MIFLARMKDATAQPIIIGRPLIKGSNCRLSP